MSTSASHRITIAAPVGVCQRFFTPAGEELWVDGWRPHYVEPADGSTVEGMVFTTGSGDDFTVWTLVDYDTGTAGRHYARYSRVTPALRATIVEVTCRAIDADRTEVEVRYTLTALTPAGAEGLPQFQGENFIAMIDGWRDEIDRRLPDLKTATIR